MRETWFGVSMYEVRLESSGPWSSEAKKFAHRCPVEASSG
jgi:hypothetical protein